MNYAEDIGHYWQTSKTSPDTWMDKAKREIQRAGGQVTAEGFVSETQTGRIAYMLAFTFGDNQFKVVWPVLPSKSGKEKAARIQATTMLYHDVKARCVSAKVRGFRAAFFSYVTLPNGQTASEASDRALLETLPALLLPTPRA